MENNKKKTSSKLRCSNCNSTEIHPDENYDTILRCQECGLVGNEDDFSEVM